MAIKSSRCTHVWFLLRTDTARRSLFIPVGLTFRTSGTQKHLWKDSSSLQDQFCPYILRISQQRIEQQTEFQSGRSGGICTDRAISEETTVDISVQECISDAAGDRPAGGIQKTVTLFPCEITT